MCIFGPKLFYATLSLWNWKWKYYRPIPLPLPLLSLAPRPRIPGLRLTLLPDEPLTDLTESAKQGL